MARKNSNLKWEVVTWANQPTAGNGSLFFTLDAPANTSQGTILVIDSAALESHDREQMTLIRLVGSMRMAVRSSSGGAGSPTAVKVRLHKGTEVQFDGAVVQSFGDPWDTADAEEEFMWERTYDVRGIAAATNFVDWETNQGVGGSPPARGDHPYWYEVDIPLKRTLRPPEVLGLTFAAKGTSGDIFEVWAWLRALVAV